MKPSRFVVILLLAVWMVSCGANPNVAEANLAQSFTPPNGRALVYVYWPGDLISTAAKTRVSIDRKSKGELPNGSFMCFQVESGQHQLVIGSDAAKLNAAANKCYYFKVSRSANQQGSIGVGGMFYPILVFSSTPNPIAETAARNEIKKCRQVAVVAGESSNIKIIPE